MQTTSSRWKVATFVIAFSFAAGAGHSSAQAKCTAPPSAAEVNRRIDQMIAAMTIPERVAQLQDRAPAIPRLNLPSYNWWNEGLHGLARDGYATVFPQAIGLAATWDSALLHAVGDTVGGEARAKFESHGARDTPRYGGLTVWSPNINIFRDPRWGRGQETYGEDPFLTGTLGIAFVTGVQGPDPTHPQANATPKHFAAHSGPETGRDSFNAVVSAHDLADTYTPAFRSVVTAGHATAIMCSYNAINGIPSCARQETLQHLLREQWGFKGYVVSDCDAIGNISAYHHYAPDSAHAAAAALNAGVDLDCGTTYRSLAEASEKGLVTEATINTALHRLLLARANLGALPELSCSAGERRISDIHSPAHQSLALRAAEESAVLLKNDGVLPLNPGEKLAIVGPTADSLKVLEANYHGTAEHPVTLLDGLQTAFTHASYAQGSLLAQGLSLPIARTAFRTGTAPDAKAGLEAEYFENDALSGEPALRTVVPRLEFDLDRVGPDPAIKSKKFSARWTGALIPPAPGSYTLHVNMERCWDCTEHDTFKLFVDGTLQLNNDGKTANPNKVTLQFADVRPHALVLEMRHTGDDEGIALEWIPPANVLLNEAESAAKSADVIVACVGLSPDLEGEALQVELPGFAGGDRTALNLPQEQLALLQRLFALHKKVIVVLTSGSAVALGPVAEQASAVLEAWYPGESGGTALAHLLTGQVNPSGRLPVTFYRSVEDLPAFTDYNMAHRTYRYFDRPVEFGFGFGLSYTTFQYSGMHAANEKIEAGKSVSFAVTVRNTGAKEGTETAEVYVAPPQIPGAPRLALKNVQRVSLKPGESRELHITLPPEALATIDPAGQSRIAPGEYHLYVGGNQPSLDHDTGLRLTVVAPR